MMDHNKMKALDYLVLVVFVAGLIALCFFQECRLDIYFLVLGFAVAAMSLVSMVFPGKREEQDEDI